MEFCVYHRYGEQSIHEVETHPEDVIRSLIGELRVEEFLEKDDEHNSVGVIQDPLGVSIKCSGLVTLFNTDQPGGERYMRNVPDERLIPLLVSLAQGDIKKVNASPWVTREELEPYVSDYYRE